MTSYLIQYLDPKTNNIEEDPLFSENTYGDSGNRGRTLKNKVKVGDYLFFNRSIEDKNYITGFYQVFDVMEIEEAKKDSRIIQNYKNHHLFKASSKEDEVIIFGDPDSSMLLETPLEVNRDLLEKLVDNFNPSLNQSEKAAISSKLKNYGNFIALNDEKVNMLLGKIILLQNDDFLNTEKTIEQLITLKKTEKEKIIKARIGHYHFKKRLMNISKKCEICGVSNKQFLIASHIKPWNKSDDTERLDHNNGLLLCPNHDALFDKGYISFNNDGSILNSTKLDDNSKMFLNVQKNVQIKMNDKQQEYMKWHKKNKFKP